MHVADGGDALAPNPLGDVQFMLRGRSRKSKDISDGGKAKMIVSVFSPELLTLFRKKDL